MRPVRRNTVTDVVGLSSGEVCKGGVQGITVPRRSELTSRVPAIVLPWRLFDTPPGSSPSEGHGADMVSACNISNPKELGAIKPWKRPGGVTVTLSRNQGCTGPVWASPWSLGPCMADRRPAVGPGVTFKIAASCGQAPLFHWEGCAPHRRQTPPDRYMRCPGSPNTSGCPPKFFLGISLL